MYGSISRFKVKPGKWEALRQATEAGPRAEGPAAAAVFQMDADGDEYYVMIVAESEKAYRANSERPDMHEAYLERLQWLESEPEWYDGKVLTFRRYPVPEGAQVGLKRQEAEVKKFKNLEKIHIPPGFDYDQIPSLSNEVRQKLSEIQPTSLGQASRISGVTPAALSILMIYLKRLREKQIPPQQNPDARL